MISKEIKELLEKREFISVASCDGEGRPNAAPKFFLKIEDGFIYLIDYAMGRTWQNLKANPRICMSFMDTNSLIGYQISGIAEIIDKGIEFEEILEQLLAKQVSLSTKRIIEGISTGKKHTNFEVAITEKFVILKVKAQEVVEIGPRGEIKRVKT